MGIFDWFKKLGKKTPTLDGGENPEPPRPTKELSPKSKRTAVETAASNPKVPGRRRRLVRDARLEPKPLRKNWWEKHPQVMKGEEADRLFSAGFRTRNREIRSLLHDPALLEEHGLPVWESEHDLAYALGLGVRKLWWLATHRFDDRVSHYVQFAVPKRSGGRRIIMAPKRSLKAVQRKLVTALIERLPVSEHAHGFRSGRSVRSNAEHHVGKAVVVKFDLEDFFGTVTFARVRGLLIALGYSFDVATALALLMTEAERQPVEVDGELRFVPVDHRYCPQGAPTSPGLCNAVAKKLDQRLGGLARSIGWSYSRYADDLTFSGDDAEKIGLLLRLVAQIAEEEGFRLNARKTRVMRAGRAQHVTGVTVNETLGLSRKERRKMRAAIHQLRAKRASGKPDQAAEQSLQGKLAYLAMLNPQQAAPLLADWTS